MRPVLLLSLPKPKVINSLDVILVTRELLIQDCFDRFATQRPRSREELKES